MRTITAGGAGERDYECCCFAVVFRGGERLRMLLFRAGVGRKKRARNVTHIDLSLEDIKLSFSDMLGAKARNQRVRGHVHGKRTCAPSYSTINVRDIRCIHFMAGCTDQIYSRLQICSWLRGYRATGLLARNLTVRFHQVVFNMIGEYTLVPTSCRAPYLTKTFVFYFEIICFVFYSFNLYMVSRNVNHQVGIYE